MAMVVKNNMSAVNTLNILNKNQSALAKSLQKVSSGMKINDAGDDASGYAISERMRVQIRSLDQDNQNTQNGNSMMRTAEGAVSSTVEILKTLKEKAINAANDTNTDEDRRTIQKEINQMVDQIDDNALATYNGKYLVDGTRNLRLLTVKQGVFTPHDPLQLRELRHHARHEIGLRELGGTPRIGEGGIVRITRRHLLDNRRRECHETLRLFVHRAEPPLEHDRL